MRTLLSFLCLVTVAILNVNAGLDATDIRLLAFQIESYSKSVPIGGIFQQNLAKTTNFATRKKEFDPFIEKLVKNIGKPPIRDSLGNLFNIFKELYLFPLACGVSEDTLAVFLALDGVLTYAQNFVSAIKKMDGAINDKLPTTSPYIAICTAKPESIPLTYKNDYTSKYKSIGTIITTLKGPEYVSFFEQNPSTIAKDLHALVIKVAEAIQAPYASDPNMNGKFKILTDGSGISDLLSKSQNPKTAMAANAAAYKSLLLAFEQLIFSINAIFKDMIK